MSTKSVCRLFCWKNSCESAFCVLLLLCFELGSYADVAVTLDPASPGRNFEGLGALSAGASSRLLMDYPPGERSRILDLLFRPNCGASLQHLKLEIGGDVNSTDGTEPSHARTREEFKEPRRAYFNRGYEWWLMREAKKRNPKIRLDVLQWGAPGWIGGAGDNRARFYSQDNADLIVSFINGAKKYHGVDIDYCGVWNETAHDANWIKLLRKTLDRNGLTRVQIVAADEIHTQGWKIAEEMLADPELMKAVQVVGTHYPQFKSTTVAQGCGKPLWASEDGPWRGDWQGACKLAQMFNRNYIEGKMTKTIIWSLITSYYDALPLPNSGPMMANEPWSAHYEIQPGIWALAHTTQFAYPGWKYIDSACDLLKDGGSYVTLRNPNSDGDYSVIIETIDAKAPQTFTLRPGAGLTQKALHVWHSNERTQFEKLTDLAASNGSFKIVLEPGSIYSLTTTTGQFKGGALAPVTAEFPFPYTDNFESYSPGEYAHYFSDQGGVFEVAKRPDRNERCLRQVLIQKGIDWPFHPTPEPYSLIGSRQWRNYEVAAEVQLENAGDVALWGRVTSSPQTAQPPKGYCLRVTSTGHWSLNAFTNFLAGGDVPFTPGLWHTLKLRMSGPRITAVIDGKEVGSVSHRTYRHGMAGVGSGWNTASYDNFAVRPVPGPVPENLALGKQAAASSQWDEGYPAACATDGKLDTRWNAAPGHTKGEWLEVDLGKPTRFNTVEVVQLGHRITNFQVEYGNGGVWTKAFAGNAGDLDDFAASFPPVNAQKLRLVVLGTRDENPPAIHEISVFNDPN